MADARMITMDNIYFMSTSAQISGNTFSQRLHSGFTVNGLELFNVSALGIDNNTFEGYLNVGSYAGQTSSGNHSFNLSYTNNIFAQNSSSVAPQTGIAFHNVDASTIGGNGGGNSFSNMVNGIEYYYDVVGGGTSQVDENSFLGNTFGMVIAPHQYPLTTGLSGTSNSINNPSTYTNTLPLEITCNMFQENGVAIIGSGNLAAQVSGGDPGNYFVRPSNINTDWDLLWQRTSNITYNVGSFSDPNSESGQSHNAYQINFVTQSASNVSFPGATTATCYAGPSDPPMHKASLISKPDLQENMVSVYPNPSHETFTVRLANYQPGSQYQLLVTDVLGRVLLAQTASAQQTQVHTAEWQDGVYYLKITDVNGVSTIVNLLKIK